MLNLIKKCNKSNQKIVNTFKNLSVCSNYLHENHNNNKNTIETTNQSDNNNNNVIIIKETNKSTSESEELKTLTNTNKNDLQIPPAPTNCCMSGCANCVWIEYANNLTTIFQDSGQSVGKLILEQIDDANMRAFLEMELRNLNKTN